MRPAYYGLVSNGFCDANVTTSDQYESFPESLVNIVLAMGVIELLLAS